MLAWLLTSYSWNLPNRWQEAGVIDNGLGFRLQRNLNPGAFALACRLQRAFSIFGFVFVAAGVVITVAWIVRAIS
jgi:hypothetical protein